MTLRSRLDRLDRNRAVQRRVCDCGGPGVLKIVWHDEPSPGPCPKCGAKPIVQRFTVLDDDAKERRTCDG